MVVKWISKFPAIAHARQVQPSLNLQLEKVIRISSFKCIWLTINQPVQKLGGGVAVAVEMISLQQKSVSW